MICPKNAVNIIPLQSRITTPNPATTSPAYTVVSILHFHIPSSGGCQLGLCAEIWLDYPFFLFCMICAYLHFIRSLRIRYIDIWSVNCFPFQTHSFLSYQNLHKQQNTSLIICALCDLTIYSPYTFISVNCIIWGCIPNNLHHLLVLTHSINTCMMFSSWPHWG